MEPDIQIVTPVHNGAETIHDFILDFYQAAKELDVEVQFIVCEDGSTDDTVSIVQKLSTRVPIHLISDKQRKGYSQAVFDGLSASTAEVVAMVDCDGQYYSSDLKKLYRKRNEADIITGYRNPRRDPWYRKTFSWFFGLAFRAVTTLRLRDPSSPFLLMRRSVIKSVLDNSSWKLPQGFWWEFYARTNAHGFKIKEVPIDHRPRPSGGTDVYLPKDLPKIALQHLVALNSLRAEIKNISARRGR